MLEIDTYIFSLIFGLPHHWITDYAAIILSGAGAFGIIWVLIGGWIFIREEKKDHWFFIPLIATTIGVYGLVEYWLKPLFARMRPEESVLLLAEFNTPTSYSFPSSHATLAFALAVLLSAKEPKWQKILFLLAVLISFSRVYLGRHYPLDIVTGAVLGLAVGYVVVYSITKLRRDK